MGTLDKAATCRSVSRQILPQAPLEVYALLLVRRADTCLDRVRRLLTKAAERLDQARQARQGLNRVSALDDGVLLPDFYN